tara:strand:- start:57 stop:227 length:171 start_codon:yes stop_codon:yes gene_type:complete
MIILKKVNHYEHTTDTDKASKMVLDGYEVLKGSSILAKAKKQAKPKKKSLLKKIKK